MIHEPTRIVGNTKSCIDLLFAKNPYLFSEVGTRDKIVSVNDHHPIFAVLKATTKKPKAFKRQVWNFKNANFEQFRNNLLNAPWHQCFVRHNVNATVSNWMDMFMQVCELSIPHYETTIRPRDKSFMNSNIRRLMRKRDYLESTSGDENIFASIETW